MGYATSVTGSDDACWQAADVLLLVPKGKGDILEAMGVADSGDAIFAPSVGPGTCVLVGKVLWRGSRQ